MVTAPKYHSHQWFNGKCYQLKTVYSDGSLAWMPKTYFEIWDQYGQTKLFNQWFRSAGAANTKAHKLILEKAI